MQVRTQDNTISSTSGKEFQMEGMQIQKFAYEACWAKYLNLTINLGCRKKMQWLKS